MMISVYIRHIFSLTESFIQLEAWFFNLMHPFFLFFCKTQGARNKKDSISGFITQLKCLEMKGSDGGSSSTLKSFYIKFSI